MKGSKKLKYIVSVLMTIFISSWIIYAWNWLQAESWDKLSYSKWNELVNNVDSINSIFNLEDRDSNWDFWQFLENSWDWRFMIQHVESPTKERFSILKNWRVWIWNSTPWSNLHVKNNADTWIKIESTWISSFDAELALENKEVLWKITNDDDYLWSLHIYNHDILSWWWYWSINTTMMLKEDWKIWIWTVEPYWKLTISSWNTWTDRALTINPNINSSIDILAHNNDFNDKRLRKLNVKWQSVWFYTNDWTDLISEERLLITENWNVGIWITNPSTKLHVAWTITETSDERLKENIFYLENSLEKISKINWVKYSWKDIDKYNDKINIWVLAQEVEEVFPELVNTSKDWTKSVEYWHLVAPLIEAIKELKNQNEKLKNRVEILENK